MTAIQKKILIAGIKIKLDRDEDLETILSTYVNLTNESKDEIRNHFSEDEHE
ncbi:hypothetical protein [Sedimentibacter sp.]|uniref:hypothetical protein n=1 Tax=Sedimentibacter sp. TaxID=1960295 RepID=UPI0028AF0B13|nr:hypothetical protein [Sedimentibacter sp.]